MTVRFPLFESFDGRSELQVLVPVFYGSPDPVLACLLLPGRRLPLPILLLDHLLKVLQRPIFLCSLSVFSLRHLCRNCVYLQLLLLPLRFLLQLEVFDHDLYLFHFLLDFFSGLAFLLLRLY